MPAEQVRSQQAAFVHFQLKNIRTGDATQDVADNLVLKYDLSSLLC